MNKDTINIRKRQPDKFITEISRRDFLKYSGVTGGA
ncbi:MAG: twin-arginine translocation signal domain-containing protein, partial [bacterium]